MAGWLLRDWDTALLKMWGRALAIFLTVGFLVYLGAVCAGTFFRRAG
jgi:hypothetical protein